MAIENRKRRVCIMVPSHWSASMGGAEYQVKLLIKVLTSRNDVRVWYLARSIDEQYSPDTYELRKIGDSRGQRTAMDACGILKALHEIRPDVIYARVGTAHVGIAAYYCRANDCKLMWHVASMQDLIPPRFRMRDLGFPIVDRCMLNYGIRKAERIITQTEEQAAIVRSKYQAQATTIRNFHPTPTEHVDKSMPVNVVWIGNFKFLKQPEVFVDVAAALEHTQAKFVMVGANQLSSVRLRELLDRIAKVRELSYVGAMNQTCVNELLARSHILVNTSITEGFSNTFIQAWMRQVPVASLNEDPDNLLTTKNLGVCTHGDVRQLTREVESMIKHPDKRSAMGMAAYRYSVSQLGMENAEKLATLIATGNDR